MYLAQLHIENLRNIRRQELDLARGCNVFVGNNGAGKTSVLEAAYVLSHAQSFRAGRAEFLIRQGAAQLALGATVHQANTQSRIGLVRENRHWQARLDQAPVAKISLVLRELALVCFDPGSHQLICGPNQLRRRFLDWGVFHVEHEFLNLAAQYRHALQQRNAALKQGANDRELAVWEEQMDRFALPLTQQRQSYFSLFSTQTARILETFLPELGAASLNWESGWPQDQALGAQLAQDRTRDRDRGHTTRGPHRAGWSIGFAKAPHHEQLSRGQEKLCALACILAQARVHADLRGDWPIIALDDLASELDAVHQRFVIDWLAHGVEQVLISGLDVPEFLRTQTPPARMFHVEHGTIRDLL